MAVRATSCYPLEMPRRDLPLYQAVLLPMFAVGACADAAADASYKGEPLDRIAGVVAVDTATVELDAFGGDLRVTLWWSTGGGGALPPERDVAPVGAFPADFVLDLFETPPPERLASFADATGQLALGQLVVYLDEDGDHAWNADVEPVYGLADQMIVAYTPAGFAGPLTGSLAKGFHHLVPTPCSTRTTLRFAGPAPERTTIAIYPKPLGSDIKASLFELACEVTPAPDCQGLTAIRQACRQDPSGPDCERCADGIFPAGATPEQCDAWLAQCNTKYFQDECGAEWKACTTGNDPGVPACDKACVCEASRGECHKAGLPDDVCDTKYADCMSR